VEDHTSDKFLKALHESGAEMRAAVAGLTTEAARQKPGSERWSALECVEHVVIAEGRFLGWLQNPQTHEVPPADAEKEAQLVARLSNRETKREAPVPVRPTGRYANVDEALRDFEATRARSIAFATEKQDELYSLAGVHPSLGPLNGVEIVHLIATHSRRHIAQILEVREALAKHASA